MKRAIVRARVLSVFCVSLALVQCTGSESAERVESADEPMIFCPDNWSTLAVGAGQGFNAVGYLSNGCAAHIIDSSHIVSAAHCFANMPNGAWFPNLMFYPNFHPSRVAANPAAVPRATVLRAVVGTRMPITEGGLTWTNDWGIAQVGNWQDTAGVDLTPVELWDNMVVGQSLNQVGYPRNFFASGTNNTLPVDVTWDASCLTYNITQGTPPTGQSGGCNSRWQYGSIQWSCSVTNTSPSFGVDGALNHNCDTSGGNSGSALLAVSGATWKSIGVTMGFSHNFGTQPPASCDPNPSNPSTQNGAPAVKRYIHAPRFASNVAVAQRSDGAAATGVFAVDQDTGRVRIRERVYPSYGSDFFFWKDMGLPAGSQLPTNRLAACNKPNGTPKVFVPTCWFGSCTLYTREPWAGGWTNFGLPPGVSNIVDLDAAYDVANNRCQVFMVTNGGNAYTRRMTSDTVWGAWETVAVGTYKAITAMRNGAYLWAVMINTSNQMVRARTTGSTWTLFSPDPFPTGVTAWTDLDLGFDGSGNSLLYGYSVGSTPARVWFQTVNNTGTWPAWTFMDTNLYTNTPPAGAAPTLSTITASRWMETDAPSATSPILFGTDTSGNVYLLLVHNLDPGWRSFYSQWVP